MHPALHAEESRYRMRSEATDATPAGAAPAPPVLSGTSPASLANSNQIFVIGTAEAGSTVNLYPDANCSGPPYPPGSAASFASPGLQVGQLDHHLQRDCNGRVKQRLGLLRPITDAEDSLPPNTFIRRIRVHDRIRRIIAHFRSDESGVRFECRSDLRLRFGRCPTVPRSVGLSLGRHTFQVRAIDAAGNIDPTPASKVVVIRSADCGDTTDRDPRPARGDQLRDQQQRRVRSG
jgi:large repetitive protein